MKKIFIFSSALLVFILFFLGIYNFAFKQDVPEKIVQPEENKETVPQKIPEKIKAVSDQKVVSPFFDEKNGTIVFYSAEDGTVWQVIENGSGEKQIDPTKLDGLAGVLWSLDHKKVLTTFKKDGQTYFYSYDHQNKKGTRLKDGTDLVVWDNAGAKIFYKYYDSIKKERSLNIADPDGGNWQKLANIDFRKISMSAVPSTPNVSYWNYPDAGQESQLIIVNAISGQPQTIFRGKYGADYLWSPDGTQALVSSLASENSKITTLGLVTSSGEYHDLNIPTMVSKCVWSSDGKTIYYALPGGIPDKAVMPNDYQENKFTTEDTFWKMDVATAKKERVVSSANIPKKYDSSNLFLSKAEDVLYFVNKIDGKLYRIEM